MDFKSISILRELKMQSFKCTEASQINIMTKELSLIHLFQLKYVQLLSH